METLLPKAINTKVFWLETKGEAHVIAPSTQADFAAKLEAKLRKSHAFKNALVFATSGSSGQPKWVWHTRQSLVASAKIVNKHFGWNASDIFGICLPTYHVGGMGMVTRSVLLGAKLSFFQQKWNAHNTYNWLIQSNISVLSLVPTQLYDLIQLNTPAPPKIKSVVIGGAFLDPALQRKAIELGYPVYASWGMTEAGSQIATAKTIGALPSLLPNWEVAQTQPATISGSALAKGYLTLNETGDVSSRLFNNYFTTSDHIELSSTGEILSVRRADSLIKVLGELISIDEITKSIQKNLPDNHSENWIIIARKHPRRGHHLWLIIEGEVSLTGEFWSALIGAWNQQIGGLKTIEGIKFTSSFPRSPLGKIQKNTLTDRLFS